MFLEHGEEMQQLQDVYEVEENVRGKGCFGTVRLARLLDAPTVVRAVKSVPKRTLKAESIVRREVSVLRHLDHPSICRLHETFEDDHCMYLVMEFVDGRELFDEIVDRGHLDEGSAAHVMQQVFGALRYCHERRIIHRDLKPENIMVQKRTTPCSVTEGRGYALVVKIIDFGLAIISAAPAQGRAGSSVTGTFDYMAPEARQGRSGAAADLWSCGVVMHVLLAGFLPEAEVLMGDEILDLEKEQYSGLSQRARDLLLGLLRPDPSARLTAAGALSHPWVAGNSGNSSPHNLARTVDALTSFHRSVKLRRAALTALAMQLTGEQLGVLREQFMAIDTDCNGRISKEELARSVAAKAPLQGAEEVQSWVESVFNAIDTDGSSEIEYTEWLSAAQLECAQRSEEDAWAAFRVFDLDGDGRIDQEELARVLAQSPEEAADLLPQIDTNGDGVVDFDEFKRLLNVNKSQ